MRASPNMAKPGTLHVIMLLDLSKIQLEQKDDKWNGMVDVMFALQTAVRDALSSATGSMTIRTDQLKPKPPPAPKAAESK